MTAMDRPGMTEAATWLADGATFAAIRYGMFTEVQKPIHDEARVGDAEFSERLRAAGFRPDFGEDDTGLFLNYLHQSRHYSLSLALQLKARIKGMDTPVVGRPEVRHLS